jgi:hypothetical protein
MTCRQRFYIPIAELADYSRTGGAMSTVSVSSGGSAESVINTSSTASEINGIVRWNMKNGGLVQSFSLDKSQMRLSFSDHYGAANVFACKWI